MSLIEVPIPSGGRAWVRTRLSHERAVARRAAFASAVTTKQLRAIAASKSRGNETEVAILDDIELGEALRAQAAARAAVVRICVARWDGVVGTEDNALTFPDDVEQLDEADFDALFIAVEKALEGPDPKATPAP